jgi:hypothetical protein
MKKRRKHAMPVSVAVLWSVAASYVFATAITAVLCNIQYNPVRNLYLLLRYSVTNTTSTSAAYLDLVSQVAPYELGVSSLSFLVGGIVLGCLLRDTYGTAGLYKTALAAGGTCVFVTLGFIWFLKLNSQGFHLNKYDLSTQFVLAQLTAIVLWLGFGVTGAAFGRYAALRLQRRPQQVATNP